MTDTLVLRGVKTHNLKNWNLELEHNKLYVVTGVSGSGKSSLAFDTLYAEGQRRYVESLSAYARQFLERMEKPEVDSVSGIRPSIAIEAKNVVTNARSTVGTQTEMNDYLRVLFSRIGRTECPDCRREVTVSAPERAAHFLFENFSGKECGILFEIPLAEKGASSVEEFLPELERQGFVEIFSRGKFVSLETLNAGKKIPRPLLVCVDRLRVGSPERKRLLDSLESAFRFGRGEIKVFTAGEKALLHFSEGLRCFSCGRTFKLPSPSLFSFNSPLGACPACQGFGRVITIDWDLVVPDASKTIEQGAIGPWSKPSAAWEFRELLKACRRKRIPVNRPWKDLPEASRRWALEGDGVPWTEGKYFSVKDFFQYLEKKTYKMHVRIFLSKYRNFVTCPDCRETRLKPEALYVRVRDKNIFELQKMSLDRLQEFLESLGLKEEEMDRVEPVYLELKRRAGFLNDVGLGYLSLSRLSRTLSGGEVQRIHLATSLGSSLVDTLYVLDEPSVGLHERDNDLLIALLKKLRDLGNTVVVVEHDRTMMEAADEILDLGPGGGEHGGRLIFKGTVSEVKKCPESLTGQYLAGTLRIFERTHRPPDQPASWIRIRKASEHNLQGLDAAIPLGRWVVVTGVSGSGKSTLVYNILYHHYLRFRGRPVQELGKVGSIQGFEAVDEMVLVDQSPIGRTPRSNPATYLKIYDDIRRCFARLPESKRQGFGPGHFSFNVDGGRCPACKGEGQVKVEMHFLADVYVACEECRGKRFKKEILEIRCQGRNIDEVLGMTAGEAREFFRGEAPVVEKLGILEQIGLGYLRLGQPATTLSGGEAQRLKLAYEMKERGAGRTLYLFDEPTTGLHYHDIHYLMQAFEALLERGHSLVIIEHNMEVIRRADYVIDLGPEGGDQGGKVVFQGELEGIINCSNSYTGKYLKQYLNRLKTCSGRAI